METKANKKKSEQLGMSFSTATAKLRKAILFRFVQETGKDICYRCNKKIKTERCLSIEHKLAWLDSKDPVVLFFDLDNISFSHLSCNVRCSRKLQPDYTKHGTASWRRGCRCRACLDAKNSEKKRYRSKKKFLEKN